MGGVVILDANGLSRNGLKYLVSQSAAVGGAVTAFSELDALCSHLEQYTASIGLLSDNILHFGEAVTHLRGHYPALRLIVLSGRLNIEYIRELFGQGIYGFVDDKARMETVIPQALRAVAAGEGYVSPQVALLPYHAPLLSLSGRDMEVLRLMASDKDVNEMASRLAVTRHVVYKARARLRGYLGVTTNEQIIPAAIERGLLTDKRLKN